MTEEEVKAQEAAAAPAAQDPSAQAAQARGEASGQEDYKAKWEASEAARIAAEKSAETLKEQLRTQSEAHEQKGKTKPLTATPVPPEVESRLAKVESRFAAEEERDHNLAVAALKDQEWYQAHYGADNDPDGKEVVQLSEMLKLVNDNPKFSPKTVEDRILNYRRAHLLLHPDESADFTKKVNEANQAAYMKGMTTGASGGVGSRETKQTKLTPEQVRMAELCGNDPATVSKVTL